MRRPSQPPISDSRLENSASRARSAVGRVSLPGGTASLRPRAWPAMIRVIPATGLWRSCDTGRWGMFHERGGPESSSAALEVLGTFGVELAGQGMGKSRVVGEGGVDGHELPRGVASPLDQPLVLGLG